MNAVQNAATGFGDSIQPEFILGASEINRASDTIAEKGQKLDNFIQYTALSVLNHVDLHGDVTVANKLFASMPKGSRKTALADFLVKYGKMAVETDRNKAKVNPFAYDKSNIEAARAKPWYEHKKEPEPIDSLDVHAMIAMLVKRIERDEAKGGKVEGDNVTLLTDLKLLAARPVAAAQPAPATVQ